MKKLLLALLVVAAPAYAGLVTHTDYTAGSVITSAGQNTNENAIFNEFNGNISAPNLAAGAVTSVAILDGTIAFADMATVVQSSFTAFANYAAYRRPAVKYITGTSIDVEANTGTLNETCIVFNDAERRCVTENTGSTDKYRRAFTSVSAVFVSGTEDSGMSPGESVTNNTWYSVYAVKSQINTANFVLTISTNCPVQTNFATLNTLYRTNGWVYLGLIRFGDNSAAPGAIVRFRQSGGLTVFDNSSTGLSQTTPGVMLSSSTSATTFTYTYASGTANNALPPHIAMVYENTQFSPGGLGTFTVSTGNSGNVYRLNEVTNTLGFITTGPALIDITGSLQATGPASTGYAFFVSGFVDPVISNGMNPML